VSRLGSWIVFVWLTAACASPATPVVPMAPPAKLPPPDPLGFWTINGQPADRRTIQLHEGPGHCGWESATFLSVSNPLGQPLSGQNSVEYVRDPKALFADITAGGFEFSVALPADAGFSGYRYGSMELWFSRHVGADAAFLGRLGIWERWPRAAEQIGCM
jgi:hypothetical protein